MTADMRPSAIGPIESAALFIVLIVAVAFCWFMATAFQALEWAREKWNSPK